MGQRARLISLAIEEGASAVDVILANGPVSRILLEAASRLRPELLVLGSSRPPRPRLFGRGLTCRVASGSPCPVLVVPIASRRAGTRRERGGETPASSYTARKP